MQVINKIKHSQLCNKCLNLTTMVNSEVTVSQRLDATSNSSHSDIIKQYNRILCGLERKGGCPSCISLFEPYRAEERMFKAYNLI